MDVGQHRRWFISVVLSAPLIVIIPLAFNFIIDPWGLNDVFHIEGVNTVKLDLHMHMRLHKARVLPRLKPATVILGISRAAQGIRTDHEAWGLKPVYNLSLDGGTAEEISRFLNQAAAVTPLKQVVIGLDFEGATNLSWHDKPETSDALAGLSNPLYRIKPYFTVEMLVTSARSAERQEREPLSILPGGETSVSAFEETVRTVDGHRKLFLRSENEYFTYRYSRDLRAANGRSVMEHFVQIVATARRNGIDLRLFISPVHARQMEVIRHLGLWPLFEQWKRKLVAILAEDAATHPDKLPIPLWDFSGYNSLTTEDVPPAGDAEKKMRWYWESSHYKPALGDLVLDRVFGHTEPGRRIPDDFGVPLGADNIDSHLSRIRNDQARYRKTHAADVAEIESLFLKTNGSGRN